MMVKVEHLSNAVIETAARSCSKCIEVSKPQLSNTSWSILVMVDDIVTEAREVQ